jgi:hypothetical protein
MVKADLATDHFIAGAVASATLVLVYPLVLVYLLLTLFVWLIRPFYPTKVRTNDYYPRSRLLGYDEHGDLRIDSQYPSRD